MEEAAKWHSVGHKIWCYGNPQSGVEDPQAYRRNFGLLLWQNDYDGAATFAYVFPFGSPWNDFDDPTYRDHLFVYPTINGIIDTIAWEGYREGVDDVRYVTTLLSAIKRAEKFGDKSDRKDAAIAKQYLETLDIEQRDLYTVRYEIIGHLLKLWKE